MSRLNACCLPIVTFCYYFGIILILILHVEWSEYISRAWYVTVCCLNTDYVLVLMYIGVCNVLYYVYTYMVNLLKTKQRKILSVVETMSMDVTDRRLRVFLLNAYLLSITCFFYVN